MKTILHITDLHIGDISTKSGDYLREDLFEGFIKSFTAEVLKCTNKVDALVISGDFIHQGKRYFENFSFAKKVIDLLITELQITEKEVGICIGNHDIDRDLDFAGEYKNARIEYNNFASPYFVSFHEEMGSSNDRIIYKKISDDILFVSLDSTWNRLHKSDKPGKITTEEMNKIVVDLNKIKNNSNYQIVIIASHYPLDYIECPDIPEDSDWYEKHFWKSGEHLKRRINTILKDVKVIWLSGDIHQPSFVAKENNLYITSGRFGTSSEIFEKKGSDTIKVEDISYTNRQGTVITIDDRHTANVQIINQLNSNHGYDSEHFIWKRMFIDDFSLLKNQPELISENWDKELLEIIVLRKFFDYEKIVVDNFNNQIALGWVMVDRLLSLPSNLFLFTNNISKWLLQKYGNIDSKNNFLFVGLDFWGSIIASNLSGIFNIENICIPTKGDKETWSKMEHPDNDIEKFKKYITDKSEIILFIDVVATGKSLKDIIEKIQAIDPSHILNFSCVSVICDIKQEKKENLSSLLVFFGTCCGSFRLPIFSKSQLPPVELLSTSFVTRDEN